MPLFSIIIPVYNRPEELQELLESIDKQSYRDFEVVVVEDGSVKKSDQLLQTYADKFSTHYLYQENKGPGLARNNGAGCASGRWLLFLDSDCLLHDNYLRLVAEEVASEDFDCFGGPDKAHPSFNTIQKA
ncbi:MAG TPA: glycosyltransferase family 2 protein, partial [Bacteroidales bacterium]|nr:glycosyltransferase family 2 protein [Bacteroidales bacterium]